MGDAAGVGLVVPVGVGLVVPVGVPVAVGQVVPIGVGLVVSAGVGQAVSVEVVPVGTREASCCSTPSWAPSRKQRPSGLEAHSGFPGRMSTIWTKPSGCASCPAETRTTSKHKTAILQPSLSS